VSAGETGIEGQQNCTDSAGEGLPAAEVELRSVAAVARKIHGGCLWRSGAAAADTGYYRHRSPIPTGTAASQRNAAIGDRLAMTGTADQLRQDRKTKEHLGSFRSWRVTVELGDADPRLVVRWLSTTADSGTGAGPLRTYL